MEDVQAIEEKFDPNSLPNLLPIYYNRLFPVSTYYKWLKYNDEIGEQFSHREFSFTLKDDIYLRYQSFIDETEMKKEILRKCPYKIDIGAVYSFRPRELRTVSSFHPVEKELVFDIDMTDYDDIRTCCSGADICRKCWPFMTIAIKILDRALREDFGFHHLLWVYSGRRGVHCWVCDEKARKLSPTARSAVVEYLSLVKGGEFRAKKVCLPDVLHPSIIEASKIINEHFEDLMLEKQEILETEELCNKISLLCNDQKVKELLQQALPLKQDSKSRWQELMNIVDIAGEEKRDTKKTKHFVQEVMFQLCYPRLDVNVSKGLNHLLKAPFCVHPKTGCICVPIDIKQVDSFDPFSVPTISDLCEEINIYDSKVRNEENAESAERNSEKDTSPDSSPTKKFRDSYKTSLHKSIKIFNDFVQRLNAASKKNLII